MSDLRHGVFHLEALGIRPRVFAMLGGVVLP